MKRPTLFGVVLVALTLALLTVGPSGVFAQVPRRWPRQRRWWRRPGSAVAARVAAAAT